MRRQVYDAMDKHIADRMHEPGTQSAGKLLTKMVSAWTRTLTEREKEHDGLV